jgi:hypothetical protein
MLLFQTLLALGFAPLASASPPAARTACIHPLEDLQVTTGRVQESNPGRFLIDEPEVRAVLRSGTARFAAANFEYVGPTARRAALASGRVRRQVALKLRARDGCNVVYVAWRIEPESGIEVSIKRNPGLTTHSQCGTRGYSRVAPESANKPVAIERGTKHSLEATLDGQALVVLADGALAWRGRLPAEILQFDGPAGFRTDNCELGLTFRTSDLLTIDGTACRGSGP